ncbi:MAG: aminopeptidase P family protein [Mycobacteriales bacterium]
MSDEAPVRAEEITPEETPAEGAASRDIQVPGPLREFMARGWAEPGALDLSAEPTAQYCAKRRTAISTRFPGETLVVPTGGPKVRANDTDYPFRPGSDFYWLAGDHQPDAVLVMTPAGDGHAATLYLAPRSDRSSLAFFTNRRYGKLWVGPPRGPTEPAAALQIDCRPLDELPGVLESLGDQVRVLRGHDESVDNKVPPAGKERDEELATALSELRLVKDDHEIAMLEEAIAATVRGFEDVVRELPRAVETSERWIEGTFNRRARVEGNDVGYGSICAGGPHATTLHWVDNDGPVRPGELLLIDMGVESKSLYTADVTRTLPINGRWSPVQRRVYDAVLEAQRAGFAATKPGNAFLDPHRAAMEVLAHRLEDWGILPVPAEQSLDKECGLHRRYTRHGTSHMLGLDVHDCDAARKETYRDGTLETGMVLTVEPGLYFQADDLTVPVEYRGIGVRIEDDVLVTEDGCRVLSDALPTDPDEIERWMAGLLLR